MATVFLGIGSNLGDRYDNIRQSLSLLEENGVKVLRCSTIIETDPVDGPPQDKYLNAVIKCDTDLAPEQLLGSLQNIEKSLGRTRDLLNGPRTIDLDILLYDDMTMQTPSLTIPHPRMFQRDFVMEPLKEIAPDFVEELSRAYH